MSAQHTPGPWMFGYSGCSGYCIYSGGKHIATSLLYKKDGGEANARLIAAAPDLLEALSRAVTIIDDLNSAYGSAAIDEIADAGRAAIAKAQGASQ